MRMSTVFPMIVLLVASVASLSGQTSAKSRFVGNYKLIKFESLDEKGASRPGAYDAGRIMYDAAGQMAAQLMRTNRPKVNPTNDTDRSSAYQSYFAYYGGYTIDEAKGTVVHHLQGSTNPSSTGTDFVRYFKFSDDGKFLTLSVKNAKGQVTGVLTWERF